MLQIVNNKDMPPKNSRVMISKVLKFKASILHFQNCFHCITNAEISKLFPDFEEFLGVWVSSVLGIPRAPSPFQSCGFVAILIICRLATKITPKSTALAPALKCFGARTLQIQQDTDGTSSSTSTTAISAGGDEEQF